jgi:glycosyltransferase involved in cell wall biosynthesis
VQALLEIEWRKVRSQEIRACGDATLTIAVSDDDRKRLTEDAPEARVVSIPTGVDLEYFQPHGRHEVRHRLVFSGSMDWYPNEDAIVYFADTILPRIRAAIPDVTLSVIGRHPSERLRALGRDQGIEITGTVDDVRPFVAAGELYVVPLRIGGGTRLKIFEALAMAKAVVSTTVGAEGLGLEPGTHIALADDPQAFADTVVRLLRERAERDALGRRGRELVEARYGWPQVSDIFERHLGDAVRLHEQPRVVPQRAAAVS